MKAPAHTPGVSLSKTLSRSSAGITVKADYVHTAKCLYLTNRKSIVSLRVIHFLRARSNRHFDMETVAEVSSLGFWINFSYFSSLPGEAGTLTI